MRRRCGLTVALAFGVLWLSQCRAALSADARPTTTQATAGDLLQCLPADVMAAYVARPATRQPGTSTPIERLAGLIEHGQRFGLLPKEGKAIADIVTCLPLLGHYAHAMALFDITSRPLPGGGYRLKDMQAALLLRTGGDNGPVSARIQALLGGYTTEATGTIETVSNNGSDARYRLTDSRLPAWAVIEWGQVKDLYLIAFGKGAFDRVIATIARPENSLARDDWFRQAHTRCRGPAARIECTVNLRAIVRRIEEVVPDRPQAVLSAMHGTEVERLVWTFGSEGRAITSFVMLKGRDKDHFSPISDPAMFQEYQLAVIPPEAGSYAVVPFDLSACIDVGRTAYLASQEPDKQERLRQWWAEVEADLGFDLEDDLLNHLGKNLIIHTYPPHPAGIPLLCTFLLEVDSGPSLVRHHVESLLNRWHQHLAQQARVSDNPLFALRLNRTEDNIWYLQAGLYGPAIAFVDSWIVISFSPEAVRENVLFLRGSRQPSTASSR